MPNSFSVAFEGAFRPRHLSPFQGEPLYWMFPRVETLGFYEADDFVKTRWKFVSFYF
jgi:hypothetical protein